jgi:virginiamycin B lyase
MPIAARPNGWRETLAFRVFGKSARGARRAGLAALLAMALAAPGAGAETAAVAIKEWPVPWASSRPRDAFFANSEAVWFVGQVGHYLASLNPKTGAFEKVDLPDQAGPHNVVVGRDGMVWYTGNLKGYIGRYDPKTREIHKIAMPDPKAVDPHTLVFDRTQEHLWFTVQGGNRVGRLRLSDEKVELIEVPTQAARPYGIEIAPDGTPWVVLFGTNKLASVDPQTLALTEHALPRADTRPRRIGVSSDGRIWYVDYAQGYVGAFDPASKQAKEWALPSGQASRPYSMAIDKNDRVWVVETGVQPNRLVSLDAKTGEFGAIAPVPSGAGTIRHMHYDAGAGQIWFGTDLNTVGYAQVH